MVRVVRAAEPRASLAVYLDDRTVWRVGRQASQVVVAAARAGTTFDDFFGLRLHPDTPNHFLLFCSIEGRSSWNLVCRSMAVASQRLMITNSSRQYSMTSYMTV